MILHLFKNYYAKFNYVTKIITRVDFNKSVFEFIILHVYIFSTAIRFLSFSIYILHNESK